MKRLSLFALTAVAGSLLGAAIAQRTATPNADDPPPFECPMCGGNIELHKQVTRIQISSQAEGLLRFLATR